MPVGLQACGRSRHRNRRRACTSTLRCTSSWLPSTSTGMFFACARSTHSSATGTIVPVTFDITATILVRGDNAASKASRSKLPSSRQSTNFSTAPCRSRKKCHGTMLEWCSMMVTPRSRRPVGCEGFEEGRRDEVGIASVDDLVKTISSTLPRAFNSRRAASALRPHRPRSPGWRAYGGRDAHIGVGVLLHPVHLVEHRPSAFAPTPRCRDKPGDGRGFVPRGSGNRRGSWPRGQRSLD